MLHMCGFDLIGKMICLIVIDLGILKGKDREREKEERRKVNYLNHHITLLQKIITLHTLASHACRKEGNTRS